MKKMLSLCLMVLSVAQVSAQITWSTPPTTISTTGVDAIDVQVGVDGSGNSYAVWVEDGYVKASTLPNGGAWSSLSVLSASGGSNPRLSVDSSGNATAIWLEADALKTATQPSGSSWGSATPLATSGASSPSIAVDTNSDVVAVWLGSAGIMSSTMAHGSFTWQTAPDTLASSTNLSNPQVAIGSQVVSGTTSYVVYAVWHATNPVSSMDAIYATSKTISTTGVSGSWGTGVAVSNPNQDCNYPKVVVDNNGNATAMWYSYNTIENQYIGVTVQASQFMANNFTWSAPVNVSNSGLVNPAYLAIHLSVSDAGNIQAIWTNSYDGQNYSAEGANLDYGESWENYQAYSIDLHSYNTAVQVTADGAAYLVYMLTNSADSLIALQILVGNIGGIDENNWIGNGLIDIGLNNNNPKLAIRNSTDTTARNGVLAWVAYDGSNTVIQATSGTELLLISPTVLSITPSSANYGVFTEYDNTITWSASSSPTASGYLVYRNGILIGQVAMGTTSYIDYNQLPSEPVTYGVSTVDAEGEQSSISTLSIN